MDSHYHPNGSTANHHQYSALPGIAPHQLQQSGHTLPPLQAQHHGMPMQHNMYGPPGSAPSSVPNTPGPSYQMQHAMQNNPYQHRQSYSQSMPQNPSAMSHNQGRPPPVPLRPMPLGGLQHSSLPPYNSSQMLGQNSMLPVEETPTHVVGSQGRRGILPSAPGKPSINATGPGASKTAMIPAKDADGKFPCPHCTKTYLHAKHLKRHLLRHTGDRPYMCVLCRDTFSRSDILKRHFQKCSIRRGNPTGASHLSHAQAHLKKSHPGPALHKPGTFNSNNDEHMNNLNGMSNMSSAPGPFGISADGRIPDANSNMTDEQAAEQARAGSLKRLSNGGAGGRDRRSMTGPGPGGVHRASYDQSYDQQGYKMEIPSTMAPNLNPQMGTYSLPNGHANSQYGQQFEYTPNSNSSTGHVAHQQGNEGMPNMTSSRSGMPMYGSAPNGQPPSNVDWAHMFQPTAQDGFMNSYNSNLGQSQVSIKAEPSLAQTNDGIFPGYPASSENINTISGGFPNWNLNPQQDPLQHTAMQIATFCFPSGSQETSTTAELRSFLSAENIKHFIEQYTNFQGHFPIIHTPTFRITETYEGLLLAMLCIGAVYSDRTSPAQVRDLMDLTKSVIERDSRVWAAMTRELSGDGNSNNSVTVGNNKSDFEQIHALMLVVFIFTWHGSPAQRENARRNFPVIVALARRAGLMQPSTSTNAFSVLHQPNVSVEHFSSASFDWNAWIEQEKRSRLLYTIFLYDAAQVVYFNIPPHLDQLEIRVPLPADDAAWDAATSAQCADALGLNGPAASRQRNPEGSRRPKQPEMHSALKALMHNVCEIQPGSTNIYSKFILIHALHVQIWSIQKQMSQNSASNGQALAFPNGAVGTPIMQHDWVRGATNGTNGTNSANTSGRATPDTNEGSLAQQHLKATNNALEKWKTAWDEDMLIQYPPSSNSLRRFGFCRDGVHFYWLGKYLLKNSHALDWQMAPDQRFTQLIVILKMVKNWVVSDTSKRGQEMGSVGDIDKDYGVLDLTLDMAQLFRPMNKQVDSPVPQVSGV